MTRFLPAFSPSHASRASPLPEGAYRENRRLLAPSGRELPPQAGEGARAPIVQGFYKRIVLLHEFSSRLTERGNEILIELCQLISFMIDQNVPIDLFIALAHPLNEIVPVQYLL